MSEVSTVTHVDSSIIDSWADDLRGPVALHLRQKLRSVEDDGTENDKEGLPIIFPPTYAMDESDRRPYAPYSIDLLSDGTKVAQIDSVGSQANHMEPLFARFPAGRRENPLAALVPQIDIKVVYPKTNETRIVSILKAGHRLGDALVRATDELADLAEQGFAELLKGNASPIARLAPTSLVFGVWDSRGEGAKLPRIVQSVIRAWDVDMLKRSAQYGPPVDFASLDVLTPEEKKEAEEAARAKRKNPAAQRGYVHVPAVDSHGGVVVRGSIIRDTTVNLVALRRLDGEEGIALRRYILGLSLVAAVEPQDGYLRQGCLLTPDPKCRGEWSLVERSGNRVPVIMTQDTVMAYAQNASKAFGIAHDREFSFSAKLAREDLAKAKKEQSKPKKGESNK
jgi:CRISPR-associated protein Csb1